MSSTTPPLLGAKLRAFGPDEGGGIAIIFAIAFPALAMLSVGAIELATLNRDKQLLQEVADTTALAAAGEISLGAESTVLARAEANAVSQAQKLSNIFNVEAEAESSEAGLKVTLSSRRTSFFGNLLPPNGFALQVSATAAGMNKQPLCVLGISATIQNGVNADRGKITATGCVVHSNKDVRVNSGSTVAAAAVQAVGAVTGVGAANSRVGAPPIDDPFATLTTAPPNWNACLSETRKADQDGQVLELNPGVHCGHFDIDKTAILKLKAGVHYFRDKLQMKEYSRLEGEFATVVFGKDLELQIDSNNVRWDLVGADTGVMAGFVLVLDRARTQNFTLDGAMVEKLEGVVYAPNAVLQVDGAGDAAEDSAWTVVVGKELRLTNSAHMLINSDYAGSEVPVPSGVGNKTSDAGGANRLIR